MKSQVVGQVTESEKEEMLILNERLASLKELKLCKNNLDIDEYTKGVLLQKISKREYETKVEIKKWWQDKFCKYKWKEDKDAYWSIDFETNGIILNI